MEEAMLSSLRRLDGRILHSSLDDICPNGLTSFGSLTLFLSSREELWLAFAASERAMMP